MDTASHGGCCFHWLPATFSPLDSGYRTDILSCLDHRAGASDYCDTGSFDLLSAHTQFNVMSGLLMLDNPSEPITAARPMTLPTTSALRAALTAMPLLWLTAMLT